MVFLRRWLPVLFALILGGGQLFAASAKEERAYAAAVSAFNDEMFARAATEFAQFIQKYRNSTNVPAAVLLQAQAEFKQGKFTDAIARLTSTNNLAKAGTLADQYAYWAGEAQFAAGNLAGAVDTFVLFPKTFPDSPLKLRVAVETASVYAQLGEWGRMIALLQEPNGIFQRSLGMDPDNELVLRGQLLLARAEHMEKNPGGAAAILESRNPQTLPPELDWQWAYLLFQVKIAAGDLNAALAATTNLLQIARLEKRNDLGAEGLAARAGVLEKLNLPDEAVAAYRGNLTNTAPVEKQQQAILKIAELAVAQNQFANAEAALESFLAQFPNSPAVDIALLTLGELHLKDYAGQPGAVNHLTEAQSRFDQFLGTFKSSPLAGKAFLDRGWCRWLAGKIPESLADFKAAAQKLPPSEDLAVAHFKMGDALFKQKDFAGALQNYRAVLDNFKEFPAVGRELGVRALYQSLRACLELGDRKGAGDALAQIVENYPADESAQSGALLLGEAATGPQEARAVFEKFEQQFPDSPLRAQVELAVARTYERESDWPAAITNYERWLENYPTNRLRPQADYALAGANFQAGAGNETNALALFTSFVTQFPNNELAPQAQWWVADHFFRAGNFTGAETNYEFVFQNTNAEWQGSPLFYPAQLMAGRAAMGRFGYSDASRYFTGLINDSNCPPGLDVQARFAYGSALMLMSSPDGNSPLANFSTAINVFALICQKYPTNEWFALAQGEMGDCYLQLTNYDAATNAYAQVFSTNSPADISARSRAQVGFGIALEKKAALATGDDRTNLLQQALDDCYLKVFDTWTGKNLREGEVADPFWVKKAGLQALPLIQMPGAGAPDKFIDQMEELFPQSKDSLEKKRAALPPAKN